MKAFVECAVGIFAIVFTGLLCAMALSGMMLATIFFVTETLKLMECLL